MFSLTWAVFACIFANCAIAQDSYDNWRLGEAKVAGYLSQSEIEDFLGDFFEVVRHLPAKEGLGEKENILLYMVEDAIGPNGRLSQSYFDELPKNVQASLEGVVFTPAKCNMREVNLFDDRKLFLVVADVTVVGLVGAQKCVLFSFHRLAFGGYKFDPRDSLASILLEVQKEIVGVRD